MKHTSAFTISPKINLQGIFVGIAAGDYTLAHELGHALGLDDCISYVEGENEQDDYQLKGSDASVDRSIFPDGSGDWMYETGRGFYEQSDLVGRILGQLLMQSPQAVHLL